MINKYKYNGSKTQDISLNCIKNIYRQYTTTYTNYDINRLLNQFGLMPENNINSRELLNNLIYNTYPNENVIKSAFVDNVLMKSSNHISIFELAVGNSRTDLCKINGSSIAYEIKTEYDNYSRLSKQIRDYLSVFEFVYVICPISNIDAIEAEIPQECGIYSYSYINGTYKFNKYKPAEKSNHLTSIDQLSILTKKECITNFKFKNCDDKQKLIQDIHNNYSQKYINSVFKRTLKHKYTNNWMFLRTHCNHIYNIDYQWFFKHNISPQIIYY